MYYLCKPINQVRKIRFRRFKCRLKQGRILNRQGELVTNITHNIRWKKLNVPKIVISAIFVNCVIGFSAVSFTTTINRSILLLRRCGPKHGKRALTSGKGSSIFTFLSFLIDSLFSHSISTHDAIIIAVAEFFLESLHIYRVMILAR